MGNVGLHHFLGLYSAALAELAGWPSRCRVPFPSGHSGHFVAFHTQNLFAALSASKPATHPRVPLQLFGTPRLRVAEYPKV